MGENSSVERVVARMHRHAVEECHRMPSAREKRDMERRAKKIAITADNKRKRR